MDDSRRRFLFGVFGVGAFTLASSALAQTKDAPPKPAEPEAPKISDEARALHSVLVARWAKDLNEQQKQGLLEAIENNVQSGQALRAKTLHNGQEPSTVFLITPPGPR